MLSLFSFLFVLPSISALKVYDFSTPSSPGHSISYLELDASPPVELPSIFILCTSHKQTKMDSTGFYHIYGASGEPWMTTKFGTPTGIDNAIGLWGPFGDEWTYFGNIVKPKLFFWYHMCHLVDTVRGVLSVSVNGLRMATDVAVKNLKFNRPARLNKKMVLGKWVKTSATSALVDEQFLAFVSNVNVFTLGNLSIDHLSANACGNEGDVLAWSSASWISTGQGLREVEEEVANVCSGEGRYNLGLPIGLDQQQAVETCRKLGRGRMTVSNSEEELREFVTWFVRKLPGRCSNIWTPYSDEAKEGLFVSLEDDSQPSFLPWAPGQPNGAQTENGLDIRLDTRNNDLPVYYYDQNSKKGIDDFICTSCSIEEFFSLKLKGVCEHTYMGESDTSIKHLIFIFKDTIYVIQNTNEHIIYLGWESSSIR